MGVMLSLEGARESRGRRSRGWHSRTAEDQACLEALAALLRSDATDADRCLSMVSRAHLATRLLPAALALAQAADEALDMQVRDHATRDDYAPAPVSPPSRQSSDPEQRRPRSSPSYPQTYSACIATRAR